MPTLAEPQHSGFVSVTKKLGLKVESTKGEAAERTYRMVN
jgi:hypothetical protein